MLNKGKKSDSSFKLPDIYKRIAAILTFCIILKFLDNIQHS